MPAIREFQSCAQRNGGCCSSIAAIARQRETCSTEPEAIQIALPLMKRHGQAFLDGIHAGAGPLKVQFDRIVAIGFQPVVRSERHAGRSIIKRAL